MRRYFISKPTRCPMHVCMHGKYFVMRRYVRFLRHSSYLPLSVESEIILLNLKPVNIGVKGIIRYEM
jgi:hypothetical protein